jgi:hypothetical protein
MLAVWPGEGQKLRRMAGLGEAFGAKALIILAYSRSFLDLANACQYYI